ncbi:MAG: ABC transporter ATP-binding protein [Chloroflexota bacterium]|nr:ABC transporter ATP-binding protein [Chloroflexota bacterium]
MTELARLERVTKTHPGAGRPVTALDDVSLAITAGELLVVSGRSGSGKTSLLFALAGIERPTSGRVIVAEQLISEVAPSALAPFRRDVIGFLFQDPGLLPLLSAVENVVLALRLSGVGEADARARGLAALADVGLEARSEHRADELSGGEQQRVSLARALAKRPRLLLADEPTSRLDGDIGRVVAGLLRHVADSGVAVVVATHDPEVIAIAGRNVVLESGRIIANGEGGDIGATHVAADQAPQASAQASDVPRTPPPTVSTARRPRPAGLLERGLASITALVALITMIVALPLFALQLSLISPGTYSGALESTAALGRLPDAVAAQLYLTAHDQRADVPPTLRALSEEQLRSVVRTVLTPEALRPIADSFGRAIAAASAGSDDAATVSFAMLKDHLLRGAAFDVYLQVIRAQPPCADSEVPAVVASAATDLPECRPPEAAIAELRPAVEASLDELVRGIPDERGVSDVLGLRVRSTLSTFRTAFLLSPLVPILFLLLTSALGTRSRRGVLGWWGALLAIGGGTVTAIAVLTPQVVEQRWSGWIEQLRRDWSPGLLGLGHDIASMLLIEFATRLSIIASIVALVGIAGLVTAARLGHSANAPTLAAASGASALSD